MVPNTVWDHSRGNDVMNKNASRQVVFALVVSFVIVAAAGDKWINRVMRVERVSVAPRKAATPA